MFIKVGSIAINLAHINYLSAKSSDLEGCVQLGGANGEEYDVPESVNTLVKIFTDAGIELIMVNQEEAVVKNKVTALIKEDSQSVTAYFIDGSDMSFESTVRLKDAVPVTTEYQLDEEDEDNGDLQPVRGDTTEGKIVQVVIVLAIAAFIVLAAMGKVNLR